jgi:hypothetical protein
VRAHIPREEERMHERLGIGLRRMMEASEKEKTNFEWMWESSSEISECDCELNAWRGVSECDILV